MKKFLLACCLVGATLAGWSQVVVNEFYTTAPQWFELRNPGSSPSPLACYTLVTYSPAVTTGPSSGRHSAGLYTLTFPSTTPDLAANAYFIGAAVDKLTYTTGSGQSQKTTEITPNINWNSSGGLVKRNDISGSVYATAVSAGTLGAVGSDPKFLSTTEYGYFLFDNNGNYVSGFVANNGSTTLPTFITSAPTPLNVTSGGCTVSLKFNTVTADKTGFLRQATGNENGYANLGECGDWGKTSTNPSVSPAKPNPPKVDNNGNYKGTLATTASYYCGALKYTISGGTAPYTIIIYNDVDNDNFLSAIDTYNTTITTSSTSGTVSGISSGQSTGLILIYRDATGCIGAVNAPTIATGALAPTATITCNSSVSFTMNGTTDANTDYSFLFPITASLYFGTNTTPVATLTGISSWTTTYTMTGYTVPKDASSPTLKFTTSAGCGDFDKTLILTPSLYNIVVGGRLGSIDQNTGQLRAFYWLDPTLTGASSFPLRVTMYEDANNDGLVNNGEVEVAHHDYSTGDATQYSGLLNDQGSDIIVIGQSTNANPCGSAQFYTAAQQAPLPVHFKSFTTVRKGDKVNLGWITATEQNNRGFNVQRNTGSGWQDIAFVFSAAEGGNSTSDLSYSFTDLNPGKGITQYRILQIDLDGKGRYSETRSVRGSEASGKLLLFPNPSSTGSVTLVFDSEGVKNVYVSDVSGRMVKQYKNVTGSSLEIKNLSNGFYTVQVQDATSGTTSVEKFIIKKR